MAESTLKILHLPPGLTDQRRDELFKKYGATKTRTLRKSEKYTITFAEFPNKEIATQVFLRLHQLEIKGQRLSIEFAKQQMSRSELESKESNIEQKSEDSEKNSNVTHYKNFLKKLNSWTGGHAFMQPPPSNLWYKYPPPTKSTLSRIAIQLIKDPVFYTQVLHLMNRMNLPPPFEELNDEFPLLQEMYETEKYHNIFGFETNEKTQEINREVDDDDEEESELESDNETKVVEHVVPVKRKKPQSSKSIKIPKFVNPLKQNVVPPSNQKPLKPEEMFEPVQKGEIKNLKIELKTVDKLLEDANKVSENVEKEVEGGFGLMFPANKDTGEEENKQKEEQEFITTEQLMQNRISVNDQRLLPVFKNYHAGKPSCRLYIKNLAKQVELKDLHFIFKKYIDPKLTTAENEYNLRLMQEGRMKGQAFVTLQNVAQAQLALEETNGYILKDKPMVVQFAKISTQ